MPPLPDLTPNAVSGLWVRFWQIAKVTLDLADYAKFAISWEFPPLSLAIAAGYFGVVSFAPLEYIHLYAMLGIVGLFVGTFVLRKRHLLARTIQTTEEVIHTENDVLSLRFDSIVVLIEQSDQHREYARESDEELALCGHANDVCS